MKKVSIIGHFAVGLEYYDGQTVKTRSLFRELCKQCGDGEVARIDTHGGVKTLIKAPFTVVAAMRKTKNVIMLPAHNGLRVFGRLLPLFRRCFSDRRIHYAVVGGWLPSVLAKNRGLARSLKRFDGIYVETSSMKKDLEAMGFENVYMLPNFKYLTPVTQEELTFCADKPYKLCMFSRIMEQKGVEDAIEAVNEINDEAGETVYSLDIYGPVDDGYKERFEELQKQFPENIRYLGAVDSEKSVEVLRDYFALLFPTKFYTEGIPGTLIDACAAGVPVITSLWVNHADVFYEGVTGWGYEFGNTEQFKQLLKKAAYAPDEFLKMKRTSLETFEKYAPERAVLDLVQRIS